MWADRNCFLSFKAVLSKLVYAQVFIYLYIKFEFKKLFDPMKRSCNVMINS